jgi:hypothetical protein
LLALAAGNVVEALPASAVKPLSMGGRTDRVSVVVQVLDIDFLFGLLLPGQPAGDVLAA